MRTFREYTVLTLPDPNGDGFDTDGIYFLKGDDNLMSVHIRADNGSGWVSLISAKKMSLTAVVNNENSIVNDELVGRVVSICFSDSGAIQNSYFSKPLESNTLEFINELFLPEGEIVTILFE